MFWSATKYLLTIFADFDMFVFYSHPGTWVLCYMVYAVILTTWVDMPYLGNRDLMKSFVLLFYLAL